MKHLPGVLKLLIRYCINLLIIFIIFLSILDFPQDPYGWLVDLMNHFGAKNGFGLIQDIFENSELDPVSMAAILRPLGNCAELLNPSAVCPMLTKCMEHAIKYVSTLEDKDLKSKDIGAVLDLLVALKLLCKCLWPNQANEMNDLRLEVILRMLKTPHFSTRMNALKVTDSFFLIYLACRSSLEYFFHKYEFCI